MRPAANARPQSRWSALAEQVRTSAGGNSLSGAPWANRAHQIEVSLRRASTDWGVDPALIAVVKERVFDSWLRPAIPDRHSMLHRRCGQSGVHARL